MERSDSVLTRGEVLFTSLLGLLAAPMCLLPNFPFHPGLSVVCVISAAMHLALFLFFPRVTRLLWNAANLVNTILLGFALHFSGGIMSPFSMFLVLVFIAGAGHRIHYPFAMACSILTFLLLLALEYSRILPPISITPSAVYASAPVTLLIALTITGHMLVAGFIYKVTLNQLRSRLEVEQAEKDSLRHGLSELEALSQMGRLAAKITHDVRGPLGAAQGLLKILLEKPELDAESRQDCALMVREMSRVEGMLGNLLKYVRPGESRREKLLLSEVVQTVLSVIQFHPRAKGIRFSYDRQDAGGVHIRANKEEVQQVLFNVLKNSVDALADSPFEKKILVDLRAEEDLVLLRFRDNGRGIPKDVLEKLSSKSFTTKQDGTGLGLLIVRELIGVYGGRMELASIEGSGTEVVLWLPVA